MSKILWFCVFLISLLVIAILFSPIFSESYTYVNVEAKELTINDHKLYAIEKVSEKWDNQWVYFDDLIERESNWNSEAKNPKSSAYGIGQFLSSTWKTVGCEKTPDIRKQIDCTIAYVELRYESPRGAIEHWNRKHYY